VITGGSEPSKRLDDSPGCARRNPATIQLDPNLFRAVALKELSVADIIVALPRNGLLAKEVGALQCSPGHVDSVSCRV
jgi:hypothetical protein